MNNGVATESLSSEKNITVQPGPPMRIVFGIDAKVIVCPAGYTGYKDATRIRRTEWLRPATNTEINSLFNATDDDYSGTRRDSQYTRSIVLEDLNNPILTLADLIATGNTSTVSDNDTYYINSNNSSSSDSNSNNSSTIQL